jgi:dolichol-phosphate mannosyltransferase
MNAHSSSQRGFEHVPGHSGRSEEPQIVRLDQGDAALDIVIPVYNEGDNIVRVLEALRKSVKTPFRVLICYDFDEDTTLEALRRYQETMAGDEKSGGVPIQLVKNSRQGVHGAIVTGFEHVTAPAVVVMPADDDYNTHIIDLMFQKFQEGHDVVVASRFMPGGCMEGCRWQKAILVRLAAFTLYHFARLPTRDASNGFRLFSRRLLETVEIESEVGFTYSIELLAKCQRLGWGITEVPALWFERKKGSSRFRILKWLPAYLRWYFYAFATAYLHKGPGTVLRKKAWSEMGECQPHTL